MLPGYRLSFHKVGQDDSGKCNIINTGDTIDGVHAALFTLHEEEKVLLDEFEGKGYRVAHLEVNWQGQLIRPFVYLAEHEYIDDAVPPYHWYKEIVSLGALHLGLPVHYIRTIDRQVSAMDPDEARNRHHCQLIERLRAWPE